MPTPAAIYQRRYRKRQREGAVHVRLDVPAVIIERLIDGGYLSEKDADDADNIGAALLKLAQIIVRS